MTSSIKQATDLSENFFKRSSFIVAARQRKTAQGVDRLMRLALGYGAPINGGHFKKIHRNFKFRVETDDAKADGSMVNLRGVRKK